MTKPPPRSGGANLKERARRFVVQMPLLYRRKREKPWYRGQTENISRSGMLFQGELLLDPSTPIDMKLVLPPRGLAEGVVEIVCKGTVVRSALPLDVESMPRMATTISHYRLIRSHQVRFRALRSVLDFFS
jgi:PilZ domain